MRFSVLSSGSKANSTFIESEGTRILIDCGLNAKQTSIRLARLGIDPQSIDAILITHEHSDHILGVSVFSRKNKIPVFVNKPTSKFLDSVYAKEYFVTGKGFNIEGLEIEPFSIVHDAADPVGFVIHGEGFKFVQATDLGRVTPLVKDKVIGANALVLESNHDLDMLYACDYPWELKQRIASSHGHLSNDTAGNLISETVHNELFHVVLGHLSENSNTPKLALEAARRSVGESLLGSLRAASVQEETPMLVVGEVLTRAVVHG